MKSGDFQVGGAIRDDSIVSIMSMGYEGCCLQEESMGTQRQGHGVIDYDYDYGDATSAKFKWGKRSCLAKLECSWTLDGLPGDNLDLHEHGMQLVPQDDGILVTKLLGAHASADDAA